MTSKRPIAASSSNRASRMAQHNAISAGAKMCLDKFLRHFPEGFYDKDYVNWERGYKWLAHERWNEALNEASYRSLLRAGKFAEIAGRAVSIESRTNLLFSFEKMALRDAVKPQEGAKLFAEGLYDFLHRTGKLQQKFHRWSDVVASLPRKQTRVLTWPVVTVFPFIAQPETHFFFKPMITRFAAKAYGFDLLYESRPSWEVYSSVLEFAATLNRDLRSLKPRDMIDLQSFAWVQGSDEYPD